MLIPVTILPAPKAATSHLKISFTRKASCRELGKLCPQCCRAAARVLRVLNSHETVAACCMRHAVLRRDLYDMAGCATALLGWVVLLCVSLHRHTEGSAAGKGLEDGPSSV